MTSRHWATVTFFALLAAFVVLGVSLVRQTASERASEAAAAMLAAVRDSARRGVLEAQSYRTRADSLASVIANLPRPVARRQVTPPVLVDVCDTLAVVALVHTLTAERDTALADVALLSASLTEAQALAATMRDDARRHAAADSARFAAIDSTAARVVDVVRPPWYRRWARTTGRAAQVGGVAVLAYMIGRRA